MLPSSRFGRHFRPVLAKEGEGYEGSYLIFPKVVIGFVFIPRRREKTKETQGKG